MERTCIEKFRICFFYQQVWEQVNLQTLGKKKNHVEEWQSLSISSSLVLGGSFIFGFSFLNRFELINLTPKKIFLQTPLILAPFVKWQSQAKFPHLVELTEELLLLTKTCPGKRTYNPPRQLEAYFWKLCIINAKVSSFIIFSRAIIFYTSHTWVFLGRSFQQFIHRSLLK